MDKSQERIRSAQAGILGAFCLGSVYLLLSGANLVIERMGWVALPLDLFSIEGLIDLVSIGITGFLFGVTYRYIVREDQNLQLKAGGILAFALVRAIAQIDVGLQLQSLPGSVWLLAGESLILFGIGGWILDKCLGLIAIDKRDRGMLFKTSRTGMGRGNQDLRN